MKAATRQQPRPRPPKDDPFRYGWRYVVEVDEDGYELTRQIPLTEEDVLHPQEGDFIVHTPWHQNVCEYLRQAVQTRYADAKGVIVLGDTRVDWQNRQGWYHGPDLAVFVDSKKPFLDDEGTFFVKKHGARPVLILEVTSPSTIGVDYGRKRREYFSVGVPFYGIVDIPPSGNVGPINLFGFKPGSRQYEPVPLDAHDRLWLESVELWLGVEGKKIYLQDAAGKRILDYQELSTRVRNLEAELAQARKGKK